MYKSDKEKKIHIGLIAQQVVEWFDEEELDWEKYGLVYRDDKAGYYSLNYEFINQLGMYKIKILEEQVRYALSQIEKLQETE